MRRDDPAGEVREELEAHFEGTVELLMARGWSEADARTEARRRFGDERRYRDELERAARHRSHRRRMRESARAFATAAAGSLRTMRRTPGLSAAVVLTLALGLGANAAIFDVVDRLLLSAPPHIADPDEVRRLHRTMITPDGESNFSAFSWPDVEAIRDAVPGTRIAASMSPSPETMGSGADAVRIRVARVDREYFTLLGAAPQLGRGLQPEDHASGAAVAVLSDAAWKSHFGGDESVIGQRFRGGRLEYEIVGVMPRGFRGASESAAHVWVPVESDAVADWGGDWRVDESVLAFSVLARVPPNVPLSAWEARVTGVLRSSGAATLLGAELRAVTTSSLVPADAPNPAATIPVSRWIAGVSLLVLLVACANAANLFLAHAERHRHETAVRHALGASSTTLRTEILARALVLSLLAAACAVLFAFQGGRLLGTLFLPVAETSGDAGALRLLVFTGALAAAAALLAGALPALRAPSDARVALERSNRVAGRASAARRVLAGVQIALCTILLAGAALFVSSFRNALSVDLGFDHDAIVAVRLEPEDGHEERLSQLVTEARARLLESRTAEFVTTSVAVPFMRMYGLGATTPDGERIPDLHTNAVGDDFFRTMGVSIERGRGLEPRDMHAGAEPVVVVSRRAAARLWPGRDAIGECLRVGTTGPCARVVGVAGDHAGASFAEADLASTSTMQAWVPAGFPGAATPTALLVRTSGSPNRVLEDIRRAAAVPGVRYVQADPLADEVARLTQQWRLGAALFSLFGVIALLVAAVGLYGVLSFEVAQRRRELGIRAALGASRVRVIAPLARFAAPIVLIGVGAGITTVIVGGGRIGELLFQVTPRDPVLLALTTAIVFGIAAVAILPPAWRAAGADPRETLSDGA